MNDRIEQGGAANATEAALIGSVLDIVSADTLPALSAACFAALREWMGSETLGLYLFAGEDAGEEIRFAANVPDGFMEAYDRYMRPEDRLLRHVVEEREATSGLAVHGKAHWMNSQSRAYLRSWGFDQTVIGPLVVDDKTVGTIAVAATDRDGLFGARDVARLAAICRATSIGLGRMRDWSPPPRRWGQLGFRGATSTRTVLSRIASPAPPRPLADPPALAEALPPRARQVAGLLCRGTTNKDIARQLDLSPYTVRDHVQQLCRRFDVANRTELVTRLLGA
ncbi:MAG TPA: LuxR C-terminal-related transcriptional regulator [Sphingomonas sp.]